MKHQLSVKSLPKDCLSVLFFEDDGLIVLNKPHGMAVYGGSGESFGIMRRCVWLWVKKYTLSFDRIDKDTLRAATDCQKTQHPQKNPSRAISKKTIQKRYLVVMGHVQADEMVIDVPLLRYTLANGNASQGCPFKRAKAGEYAKAKPPTKSKLYYDLKRWLSRQFGKAYPATGHTHQIRGIWHTLAYTAW